MIFRPPPRHWSRAALKSSITPSTHSILRGRSHAPELPDTRLQEIMSKGPMYSYSCSDNGEAFLGGPHDVYEVPSTDFADFHGCFGSVFYKSPSICIIFGLSLPCLSLRMLLP